MDFCHHSGINNISYIILYASDLFSLNQKLTNHSDFANIYYHPLER